MESGREQSRIGIGVRCLTERFSRSNRGVPGQLLFLCEMGNRFAEMDRLADLSAHILDETGEFIHAMPYLAGSYGERTPLMHEIRADRVHL